LKYKVLIVEDQEMPRQLLEIFIERSESFEHMASVSDASLAVEWCRSRRPDLILMDVLTEGEMSGLDAAAEIKKESPQIRIIIITSMPEYSWLDRAKACGIDSFWYKETREETILSVMERTMKGERVWPDAPPEVRLGLARSGEFTERELDVLRELLTGDSNSDIGERLGISASTVKTHVQHMLEKTGFKTRTELASVARSLGLVIK